MESEREESEGKFKEGEREGEERGGKEGGEKPKEGDKGRNRVDIES